MKLLRSLGSHPKTRVKHLFSHFADTQIDHIALWNEIKKVTIKTILPMCPLVPKTDKKRFELFGFDFLLDSNLKPWLVEVNLSPSLALGCREDKMVKEPMMHDMLDVLFNTTEYLSEKSEKRLILDLKTSYNEPLNIGNFELIFPFNQQTENISFVTENFDQVLTQLEGVN